MDDNEIKETLTDRQLRVIPFLLDAPSIEEGCKKAKVAKATLYGWLKEKAFKEELRNQREEVVKGALETLKANVGKATETLVKHLDSEKENISIRAAENIIEFTQKSLELENLERRIESLEQRSNQRSERSYR